MLKIDLNLGDAKVTSDEFNYIIHLRRVKQKGTDAGAEYWQASTYHNNLTQVSKELARLAGEGYDIFQSKVFEKIETLLDAEAERINKKLNKGAK